MQPDIIITAALPPLLYDPLKADYRCHDYYQSTHKPGLLAAESGIAKNVPEHLLRTRTQIKRLGH